MVVCTPAHGGGELLHFPRSDDEADNSASDGEDGEHEEGCEDLRDVQLSWDEVEQTGDSFECSLEYSERLALLWFFPLNKWLVHDDEGDIREDVHAQDVRVED